MKARVNWYEVTHALWILILLAVLAFMLLCCWHEWQLIQAFTTDAQAAQMIYIVIKCGSL